MSTESVYNLITSLCQISMIDGNENLVKNLRSKTYEILLKKTYDNDKIKDPIKELKYHQFNMQINSKSSYDDRKCEELQECITRISNITYFTEQEQPGGSIIKLLCFLRNTKLQSSTTYSESLVPFPKNANVIQSLSLSQLKNNPYMPSHLRQNHISLLPINIININKNNFDLQEKKSSFFKLNTTTSSENSEIYAKRKNKFQFDDYSEKSSVVKGYKRIPGYDWEHLGDGNIEIQKPFACETESFFHLQYVTNPYFEEIKIVGLEVFLRDLKYVVVGIRSESFLYTQDKFSMLPNLTIKNISPDNLKYTVDDLVECGTCYKRLQNIISKNCYTYKHLYEGFIFKALCKIVDYYLAMFKKFIMAFHDKSILQFKNRVIQLVNQLLALSKILGVHPACPPDFKIPIGSDFLGYFYKEIIQITKEDILMFYISILRKCCTVYFMNFQKWIFNGILDDPSNELFIYHINNYRPNTKKFFDKAYLIKKESVPEFLIGFEDDLLLCGKYTKLLKSFKPSHPLFTIKPPEIVVCLSFEQLEKTKIECAKYFNFALKICGPSTSVSKIFQQKIEMKNNFYSMIETKFKEDIEKWKIEKIEKAVEESKNKKFRLDELKKQMDDYKEQKLADKVANINEEKFYIQLSIEMEEKQIAKEQEASLKRIKIYEELHKLQDEKTAKKKLEEEQEDIMKMSQTSECFITPEDGIFTLHVEIPKSEMSLTQNENYIYSNEAVGVGIKKSHSDILNSNLTDEFTRNKQKVLGSDTKNYYFEYTDTKDLKEEVDSYNKVNNESIFNNNFNQLTDAQKNKLKVLGHEYGIEIDQIQLKVDNESDIAKHRRKVLGQNYRNEMEFKHEQTKTIPNEFSDLEINRNKIMASDINKVKITEPKLMLNENSLSEREINKIKVMSSGFNDKSFSQNYVIKVESGNDLTDLEKNRMKVMSQEYDMFDAPLPYVKQNLNLDLDRVKNKRKILESEFNIITGTPMSTSSDITPYQDDENNNNSNDLKLNTTLRVLKKFGVPDTALLNEPTPESALNTAGLLTKQGFVFPNPETKDVQIDTKPSNEFNNFFNEQRKRATRFFPLPMDLRDDEDDIDCNKKFNLTDTRNINGTTLTEFLQMSVVIPMNTQLKIVNNEILKIFLEDLKIFDHFRSLRNYLFLIDGEFGSRICDGLISRLENDSKPTELLRFQTLHMILENALASSINSNDKNSDKLSFSVTRVPETFDVYSPDVLSYLTLRYEVKWPLNLILNTETLEQYSNIFNYLIKVRRVSWLLDDAFKNLKFAVKEHGQAILFSPQYCAVQQIRHKFLHFMMTLQNHITSTALQAAWKTFKDELCNAKTMEDLYRTHINYIKRILFLMMLNRKSVEFHKAIDGIFKIVIRFCRRLKSKSWEKKGNDLNFTHSKYLKMKDDESKFEGFIKYTIYLGNKIVRHGYQTEIGDFINLININGYYDHE